MTSAKALTAGYMPMGAVITRDEIADAMPIFRHVHTFSGHAVAAAAANAVIDIKTREKLIPKSLENGRYLQAGLQAAIGDHPMVGQIRGMGSWHAVDFTSDKKTKAAFEDDTVRRIARRMLDLGVIVSPIGTSVEVAPPLIVTHDDLDRTVETFKKAIDDVAALSAR
jgi:adenosylmethionine-8-amino-7-oxononanoate aminotransferase